MVFIYLLLINWITFKNLNVKNGFEILGSAHNQVQMKNKEKQGCNQIFISPIFKTNKSKFFLNTVRFNLISKGSNRIHYCSWWYQQ